MRRFVSVAGLACLGVIGGTVVANAGSAIPSPETFTLVGNRDRLYFDDEGKRGTSPGDLLVFTLELTDGAGTRRRSTESRELRRRVLTCGSRDLEPDPRLLKTFRHA